jgi:hypothetical protein
MGQQYANLEIRILKQDAAGYPVELELNGNQQFWGGYLGSEILSWRFDPAQPLESGQALFNLLIAHPQTRRDWIEIWGYSPRRRLRLSIDETAPELYTIPDEPYGNLLIRP